MNLGCRVPIIVYLVAVKELIEFYVRPKSGFVHVMCMYLRVDAYRA